MVQMGIVYYTTKLHGGKTNMLLMLEAEMVMVGEVVMVRLSIR